MYGPALIFFLLLLYRFPWMECENCFLQEAPGLDPFNFAGNMKGSKRFQQPETYPAPWSRT
jgi:hypothetical protein